MPAIDPTSKAQLARALAQVLPEPAALRLENSHLCGPFENRDWAGLTTAYPPETGLPLSGSCPGKHGEVHWRRSPELDGSFDQPGTVSREVVEPHSVIYYSAEVESAGQEAVHLAIQAPAVVRVWLNGVLLIATAIPEDANLTDSEAWAVLKPGTNRLLVKMMNEHMGEFPLTLRVSSYGSVPQAVDCLTALEGEGFTPAVKLLSKMIRAELLASAGEAQAVLDLLAAVRQDAYATKWDAAWADAVEKQYKTSGQFAPFRDPAVEYEPVNVQPYPEFWPQSGPTAKELLVVDVSEASPSVEFAMTVMQGLVNRSQPRLYLLHTRYARQDGLWLDELHLEGFTSTQISVEEAWKRFTPEVKGAILYDGSIMDEIGAFHSDQLNQTNVLMMMCALSDCLPLTPELNQALGLPVVEDVRGKWTDQYDMMRWAYIHLFPQMDQHLIATNYPGIFLITDYLVSFKIFTFWFPEHRTTLEENLLRGMLASTPPNSPILGWWFDWMPNVQDPQHRHADAVMEGEGVRRGSFFGKMLTPSHEATNLTVHSGVPLMGYTHKAPYYPEYDPTKIYYTYMISDGDNMGEALMMRTRDIQWDKPERGTFPMGWSFAPATSHLAPTVLNYYLRTASANDILMGGLGVAYTEPRLYLRAFPKQFDALWEQYARDTDKALRWIDSTVLWLINGRHEEADRYAKGSSGQLRGIFIGYGGSPEIAEARVTHNDVVAFYPATRTHWSDNSPTEERTQAMVDEIRAGVRQVPDFIEAWVLNWGLDMKMLVEVSRRLGPDYVCVRPDVLAEMRVKAK